jgi:hypothetical protein
MLPLHHIQDAVTEEVDEKQSGADACVVLVCLRWILLLYRKDPRRSPFKF